MSNSIGQNLPQPLDRAARGGEREAPAPSVGDVGAILWRSRWLIVVVLLATVGSTLLSLWVRDDVYEVGSRVLIRYGRDAVSPRTAVSSSTAQFMPALKPDLATEADLLRSLVSIEAVVDELGLDRPKADAPPREWLKRIRFELKRAIGAAREWGDEILYAAGVKRRLTPRESAIVAVAEALSVDYTPESSVLEARFVTKYRDEAPVVLNALVERYRQRRAAVENNPTEVSFYREQVQLYERRLHEKEELLEEVKRKYGVYADLSEQTDIALRYRIEAEQAVRQAEAELAAAGARERAISTQIASVEPVKQVSEVGERNDLVGVLQERRSELEIERQSLRAKFHDDHPAVTTLNGQIAKIDDILANTEARIAKSVTTGVNPNHENLERQSMDAQQQTGAFAALLESRRARLAELDKQLTNLREARVEYAERQREIGLEEFAYGFHERKLEEAIAGDAMTTSGATNIVVIDPAVAPIKPLGMRKSYILGGSLAVGLVLALGLALGLAALDDTVHEARQLEIAAGLPVLATIGYQDRTATKAGERYVERAAFELAALAAAGEGALRAGSIALVGAHPGAGASTLSTALGEAATRRYGRRFKLLAFEDSPGRKSAADRGLLPPPAAADSGTRVLPPESTEVDVAREVRELNTSDEGASLVVLDVTAARGGNWMVASEAARKAGAAQLRLLVVEAGRTTMATVDEIRREFERIERPLHGAIVNKARPRLPRFLDPQR